MKITGLEGMTVDEVRRELAGGAKFVYYKYTVSVIVITFRRASGVYFVKSGQNRLVKGLPWTFLTLFLGWWGIPWGPIYSIGSLYTNLSGGEDVTVEIERTLT